MAFQDFDGQTVLRLMLKYFVEGLVVGIVAYYLPSGRRLPLSDVLVIALTAGAILAVLDVYMPLAGGLSRAGLGLAVGANLAGLSTTAPVMV